MSCWMVWRTMPPLTANLRYCANLISGNDTDSMNIEILDFGYPQNTETDTLKMYITTEGIMKTPLDNAPESISKITMQATGAQSWRRNDIKYRKNEAFVDVIED